MEITYFYSPLSPTSPYFLIKGKLLWVLYVSQILNWIKIWALESAAISQHWVSKHDSTRLDTAKTILSGCWCEVLIKPGLYLLEFSWWVSSGVQPSNRGLGMRFVWNKHTARIYLSLSLWVNGLYFLESLKVGKSVWRKLGQFPHCCLAPWKGPSLHSLFIIVAMFWCYD